VDVGSYDTPEEAWAVVAAGDYAYVAVYDFGLLVLRFAPPSWIYLPLIPHQAALAE